MAESSDGPFVAPEREPQGDLAFWGEPSWRDSVRRPRAHASWLEELGSRLRDGRIGVVAVVALALVAGVVFYKVGSSSGAASASPAPASTGRRSREPTTTTSGPTPTTAATSSTPVASSAAPAKVPGSRVVVHVAGAVVTPGVVQLVPGSRVIDAIEAAGGGLANADLDRLNLAAKVVDGERVLVQHVGDATAPVDPNGPAGDPSTGAAAAGPVNLNTATEAQLEQLPGISRWPRLPALPRSRCGAPTRRWSRPSSPSGPA